MLLDIKPNIIDEALETKTFLFYGAPGTRKTSIACKLGGSILLATERGYKFIDGVHAVDIKNWSDFKSAYRDLRTAEVKEKFQVVIMDRADTLYDMCKESVLKGLGIDDPSELGYGAAWSAIKKEFNTTMQSIERLGYGMVFICHDKPILNKAMEKIGTKIELENTGIGVIRGLVDFIFNLRFEYIDDKHTTRTVYAYSQLQDTETKSRARYLNPKFEFTFENLSEEIKDAINKQKNIEGIETQMIGRRESIDRPFEEVRDNVLNYINKAISLDVPELTDITTVVGIQLQGKKISEVDSKVFYDRMLVIENYLSNIPSLEA